MNINDRIVARINITWVSPRPWTPKNPLREALRAIAALEVCSSTTAHEAIHIARNALEQT